MTSRFVAAGLAGLLATGCLPYTVGSTARTVPAGETRRAAVVYFIPDAVDLFEEGEGAPMRGTDLELRYGIDDKSDMGFRIPAFSGAVFTYKRRLAGTSAPDSPAVAVMAGGGVVNWGEHAEAELTLLASGRDAAVAAPYGGLRVMQVIPISQTAVHDSPSIGGFLGIRLRFGNLDVSPELGVFHDPSALDLRSSNVIFVPGVTFAAQRSRSRR